MKTQNIKHDTAVIDIEQYIDREHLSSLWYGGCVASIFYKEYELSIVANGDIFCSGCIKGEYFKFKDKQNGGYLYDVLGNKITDYELMQFLTDPENSLEDNLCFDDSNWFEVFITPKDGKEYSESYVLDADTLPNAVAEVLANAEEYIRCAKEDKDEITEADREQYVIDKIIIKNFNIDIVIEKKENGIFYNCSNLRPGFLLTVKLGYENLSDALKFVVTNLLTLPRIINEGGSPDTELSVYLNKYVRIYQDGKDIKSSGDFSLPEKIAVFNSDEEARMFMQGVWWTACYSSNKCFITINGIKTKEVSN